MASKWIQLASHLGMSTEAKNIDQGNGDVEVKCTKMLSDWIDKDEGEDKNVSWNSLLEALRKMELNKVANKIEKKNMEMIII